MTIRPYVDTDYPSVQTILQDGGLFDAVWDARSHWMGKIEQDPKSILVAEVDGGVVGCLLIVCDAWEPFLYRLAVAKAHRNRGIASALMEAGEQQLRIDGAEEVSIFVDETNPDLQQYYEKRGYIRGGNYRSMYKKLQQRKNSKS